MNQPISKLIAACHLASVVLAMAAAAQEKKETPEFSYQPPVENLQPARVAGIPPRGKNGAEAPEITLVTPNHIAGTFAARPTLIFHQSEKTDGEIEIVVTEANSPAPLFRKVLDAGLASGFRTVAMDPESPELKPGVQYQWSTAFVLDRRNRSSDVFASGYVVRLENADLEKELATANGKKDSLSTAARLAGAGGWYDAIAMLVRLQSDEASREAATAALKTLLTQGSLDAGKLMAATAD